MTTTDWNWKARDGSGGGLLYESGNWGDLLKLLWLTAIARWKTRNGEGIAYFDPFAGDVRYPLGRRTHSRFRQAALTGLEYIRAPFLEHGCWPSSASALASLGLGRVEVFDADPERRRRWREAGGVTVLEGESAWPLVRERRPGPDGLWLIDPYDFLAEWRERLPLVLEKAAGTTVLVYIYNRSARREEAFREYRAFRNALEDTRGERPRLLGRAAADAFLPRAHHEMLFLPGPADAARSDFADLEAELEETTMRIAGARERAAAFEV